MTLVFVSKPMILHSFLMLSLSSSKSTRAIYASSRSAILHVNVCCESLYSVSLQLFSSMDASSSSLDAFEALFMSPHTVCRLSCVCLANDCYTLIDIAGSVQSSDLGTCN